MVAMKAPNKYVNGSYEALNKYVNDRYEGTE